MEYKIIGSIRDIFYKTDKGYTVGVVRVKEATDNEIKSFLNKTLTFTGNFHEISNRNDYILYGELIEHPKYGKQFSVSHYEKVLPDTKDSVIAFLSSGMFPGIGVRTATKIVKTLGDNALDKIIDSYECLLQVPGFNEQKAVNMYEILLNDSISYKVIIYLENLGFTVNEANKIYGFYKAKTIEKIESNIFDLVEDIDGIGFGTIDKIRLKLDIKDDDRRRIYASITYSIYDLCNTEGSTYVFFDELYDHIQKLVKINSQNLVEYLTDLKDKIVIEDDKYFLKSFYELEQDNALKILNIINTKVKVYKNIDDVIEFLEKIFNIKYNELQKEAISLSVVSNFLVITGGPGTGKTTIVKAIIELYKKINSFTDERMVSELILLSPTGKASKRLKETTGYNASTIHKFLKWNKEANSFSVNDKNKSDVRFVIVDEASMIDVFLMNNLLLGLRSDVKLILIGDYNQLPSVGPGQVLRDLIESNKVPVVMLNELYRQGSNSYIVTLANDIRLGVLQNDYLTKKTDYNFIQCTKVNIETAITQICKKAIDKGYSDKDVQVLVPMYKGINGIDRLNIVLQNLFNPKEKHKKEIVIAGITYRENDKILQLKNVNDFNISNGDIGIILSINHAMNRIVIDFDGEEVELEPKDFDNIKLGYAISIHKSQGSEFDIVIVPCDMSFSRMLYRKLIYTAVTRAKKTLMLVGESTAFELSVSNEKENNRKTYFKNFLQKFLK